MPQPPRPAPAAAASNGAELQKLRMEVRWLEALVRKLQNELTSEREYAGALESQLNSLSTVK